MKLFVVLACLAAATSAFPQHSVLSALTRNFTPEIPEGCTFISDKQEVVNGVIQGEYSYKDPVGSTIIVSYSLNEDGTNYSETRKIIKAYKTDEVANSITIEQVVELVINQLKETIVTVIQQTVKASSISIIGNEESLVITIIEQLRPVVLSSVRSALAVNKVNLNDISLTEKILVEITPFVRAGVSQQVEIRTEELVDQIVTIVINDLRPSVIRIISATVRSASAASLAQYGNLVDTIAVQLRPVVFREVKKALASSSKYRVLDAEELTTKIMIRLKPEIAEGVEAQIRELEAARQEAARLEAARQEAARQEAARQEAARQEAARQEAARQEAARLEAARQEAARKEAARQEAARQEAARQEAARLEAARQEAARIEAERLARLEAERKEAERLARLEAERKEAERLARLEAERKEAERLARIEAERKEAERLARIEAERKEAERLARIEAERKEAERLARIEAERKEAERLARIEAERKEAARLEAARQEAIRLEAARQQSKKEIVRIVISQLEPIVLRIIPAAVRNSNEDLNNYQNLAETIMVQLRPVVFKEVTQALRLSTKYSTLSADKLTNLIVVEIRPFVVRSLKKEVETVKAEDTNLLIERIINRLEGIVVKVIKTTVAQEDTDLGNKAVLVDTIVAGLNPVVLAEVRGAIQVTQVSLNAQQMTAEIMLRLRPFIVRGVETEISKALTNKVGAGFLARIRPIIREAVIKILKTSGAGLTDEDDIIKLVYQQFKEGYLLGVITEEVQDVLGEQLPQSELEKLLDSLRPDIRTIVVEEISSFRQTAQLSSAAKDDLVAKILVTFESKAKQATLQYLTAGNGVGQSDDQIASAVMASLRGQIKSQLFSAVSSLDIVASGYYDASEIVNELMSTIMGQMRVIILRTITLWRAEQAALVTPAPVNKVVSIFGTGKGNSVKVETPNYNFNYAFD